MREKSRIRFNPVTKEIEVEGTEKFVKAYFKKLQAMMSGSPEKTGKKEKTGTAKKVTNIEKVITLINRGKAGISTDQLKKKTGLSGRQIWSIVNRASKEGKIRKMKRGMYSAVSAVRA